MNTKAPSSEVYRFCKDYVISCGCEKELEWQDKIKFEDVNEQVFLQEYAWVVLSSGMANKVIEPLFPMFRTCFDDFEDPQSILKNQEKYISAALEVFGNKRKVSGIVNGIRIIEAGGFDNFKAKIPANPMRLKILPFIGDITVYHLLKNIGFQVAKPDRHLVRIARIFGYDTGTIATDVQAFCEDVSRETGDSVNVVDLAFWRFATLIEDYAGLLTQLRDEGLTCD